MQKFVVIELNDEASTIDVLSYCVKKNFERVSLLSRLEDHPYLRDDQDVVQDNEAPPEDCLITLTDDERERLLKMISNPSVHALSVERPLDIHPAQDTHIIQQHQNQIPSTSAYSSVSSRSSVSVDQFQGTVNSVFYIKPPDSQYKEQESSMSQFDATVNQVAHGQAGMSSLDLFNCNSTSPENEILRRKTPQPRKQEDSIKATCKICGHDVMYNPQRTWNLMRHVWIMHESPKPYRCSLCSYEHIKPYVRKHIDSQHKHSNATIEDNKVEGSELQWSQLLDQCFGVTYRKWKHHKEDTSHTAAEDDYARHHFSPDEDVMVTTL